MNILYNLAVNEVCNGKCVIHLRGANLGGGASGFPFSSARFGTQVMCDTTGYKFDLILVQATLSLLLDR